MNALYYRPNTPTIVHQTLDNETIIIHLESGAYYSLRSLGAETWNLLDEGYSLPAIAQRLAASYEAEPATIEADLRRLCDELSAEALIAPAEKLCVNEPATPATGTSKAPYSAPVLEKFTDMTDLLLLDPIHEVTNQGWPHTPQNSTANN